MVAMSVSLSGEVRFPGVYNISRGETLSQVIKRAGGLTDLAYTKAAIFTRVELAKREEQQLKKLQGKLEKEARLQEFNTAQKSAATDQFSVEAEESSREAKEQILETLAGIDTTGRMVISLQSILNGTFDDINLKSGDALYIPQLNQEISVVGEIQHPTSHLYNADLRIDDYLQRSGGLTEYADENRIYIVKADGSVLIPNTNSAGFFRSSGTSTIEAGDTVVVPVDLSETTALAVWAEATQVIYQLAIATAAINSF